MTTPLAAAPLASLAMLLRALKLPTVARHAEEIAQLAEREAWTFERYLHHLVELEVHERRQRRIDRYRKGSELPHDKTLATLQRSRLPAKVAKMLSTLCEGAFVERGDNLLAFGLPGRGKTHLVCAIGHELIQRGYRVLFTATFALVQRLLAAKRDLRLESELAILDGYDAVILDDIGYVQQNRDEMEVLFTFLAERYERRTVIITSNLVFSEWDRIFKDPMTTAAAIDRLVHHCVIVEMTGPSIRADQAHAEHATQGATTPTTTDVTTTTAPINPTTTGAAQTAPAPMPTTPATTSTATNANPTTEGANPTTTTSTATNANPTTTEGANPTTTTSTATNANPATEGASPTTTTSGSTNTNPTQKATTTATIFTAPTNKGATPKSTTSPATNTTPAIKGASPTTTTRTRTKNRESGSEADGEM
jgi:DNA replication protein DnaC